MAQNTNFKGNKNNNQKKKLPYIKVKIDKIISLEESKTKAFASVTIGGAVVVHGVRIMNSAKGLFVAMPANVMLIITVKNISTRLPTQFPKKPGLY